MQNLLTIIHPKYYNNENIVIQITWENKYE